MQTIQPVDLSKATSESRQLLESFEKLRGRSSNMLRTMAHSPAMLETYLYFNRAFDRGKTTPKLRLLITAAIAEFLGCEYMISLAAGLAIRQAINPDELAAARTANSTDPRIAQALKFAVRMVDLHGHVEPQDIAALHDVGHSDEEIVEIIGIVSLNLFRNYFNLAVRTEPDLPQAQMAATDSAAR